jgi:LytR cell envelope-related transcriptional attenuator
MSDGATDERTARRSSSRSDVDPIRAGVVVVLFVAGVVLLLGWVVPHHAVATATTTTTTTTVPPRAVVPNKTNVQVANGTSKANQATFYTNKLQPFGWVMQPPLDAFPPHPVTHTVVYFAPTWQPAAKKVAAQLGLNPQTSVTVRTGQTGVAGAANDQVIVVIGPDLAHG